MRTQRAFCMDLPLLYLPRVSFTPWLFPLRRSTFRFPFTRYFLYIQRYIVRQLGIFKPHGVQAICSGDQVALSFSLMYSIAAYDRNIPR